jgi:hypothetical protein
MTAPEDLDAVAAADAETVLGTQAPDAASVVETPPPDPVLITVHEVAFSTAAAGPVRRSALHRWAETATSLLEALDRRFLPSAARTRRHDQQRRYVYIEDSRMAREMDRL